MKKYEREIRDLLDKMDTFVPETPTPDKERSRDREPEREPRKRSVGVMPPQPIPIRPRRSASSRFGQWLADHQVSIALRYMLGGVGLVIAALIIAQNFKDLLWLSQLLGAVGGLLFLAPVLIRFFKGKDLDEGPQHWRGETVGNEHFSWSSMKKWFGGRRKRNKGTNDPWNDRNRGGRW